MSKGSVGILFLSHTPGFRISMGVFDQFTTNKIVTCEQIRECRIYMILVNLGLLEASTFVLQQKIHALMTM